MGGSIPDSLRRRVRRRAKNRCEYCHYPQAASYAAFHCDHLTPESLGGPTTFHNLLWACPTCNGSKQGHTQGLDPLTKRLVPLFDPRKQKWDDHFAWTPDGLRIRGKTPVGRATVRALRMNRRGVTLIRALLLRFDMHPGFTS